MKSPTGTTIGTTYGLCTKEFCGEGCEQACVEETGDEQRPIRLEFWEGYSVPNIAVLTRDQAIQLAFIILGWAGSPISGLTGMLRENIRMEPECDIDAQAVEIDLNTIKATFKKWLAAVGLPDYFSLTKNGEGFNSTISIRQLLVSLVDEP